MARHPHRAACYYPDLLISAALAWSSIALAARLAFPSITQAIVVVGGAIALLRAVYFVHEIVHLPPGRLPAFPLVWLACVGIPTLVPRFMAEAHASHHHPSTYGTISDPEYAPVPSWGRARLLGEIVVLLLAPPLLVLRFGVVAPLSWVLPPLRRLTIAKLSTLATQPGYSRPPPGARATRRMIAEEALCTAWVWTVASLLVLGVLPLRFVLVWWIVAGLALAINEARTLVAHAYEGTGAPMTLDEQVRDTLTLHGSRWWTEAAAPLGTRFHAVHHVAPGLPYHALGRANAELLAAIPDLDLLRPGDRRGLGDALAQLWSRASRSRAA